MSKIEPLLAVKPQHHPHPEQVQEQPVHASTAAAKKIALLCLYFASTMALTLHTKWIMHGYNRKPWLLSAYHLGISGIGATVLTCTTKRNRPMQRKTSWKDLFRASIVAFAVVCALNIAVSNVSLQMISLSLHQIIRSGTPLITLGLEWLMLERARPGLQRKRRLLLLVGVLGAMVIGIVLSILGERSADAGDGRGRGANAQTASLAAVGVTVAGAGISAFKGVFTSLLLSSSSGSGSDETRPLSPLQLLLLTSPLATVICAVIGLGIGGEAAGLAQVVRQTRHHLLLNGLLAFVLNWSGFAVNKETSALTITVAGNIKQALTVTLGIFMFETKMTVIGVIGLIVSLCGGLVYGYGGVARMLGQWNI